MFSQRTPKTKRQRDVQSAKNEQRKNCNSNGGRRGWGVSKCKCPDTDTSGHRYNQIHTSIASLLRRCG